MSLSFRLLLCLPFPQLVPPPTQDSQSSVSLRIRSYKISAAAVFFQEEEMEKRQNLPMKTLPHNLVSWPLGRPLPLSLCSPVPPCALAHNGGGGWHKEPGLWALRTGQGHVAHFKVTFIKPFSVGFNLPLSPPQILRSKWNWGAQ